MTRLTARAITAVFVLIIGLPLVALAAGFRSGNIENKTSTELSTPSVAGVVDASWFSNLSDVLTERFPARTPAVKLGALIDLRLFVDSPSDKVVLGRDGWLFYARSLSQRCPSDELLARFEGQLTELDDIFAAVGKRIVVGVAPDKASIYPDRVKGDIGCVRDVRHALEGVNRAGFVTVWDDLIAMSRDNVTYRTYDSHWDTLGASTLSAAFIDAIDPGVWDPGAVNKVGEADREGDLSRLIGLPLTEMVSVYRAIRDNVEVTGPERISFVDGRGDDVPGLQDIHYSSTGNDLIPGNTLVLHDSFGWYLKHTMSPYFAVIDFVQTVDPERGYLRSLIENADIVVYETVQRHSIGRIVGSNLPERFVAALADLLAVDPIDIEQTGSTVTVADRAPGSGARFYLVVELDDPGGEAVVEAPLRKEITLDANVGRAAVEVPRAGLTVNVTGSVVSLRVVAVPRRG